MAFTSPKQPSASSSAPMLTTTSTVSPSNMERQEGKPRRRRPRSNAAIEQISASRQSFIPPQSLKVASILSDDQPDNPSVPSFDTRATGAFAPTALMLGGTAAMYTSLLHHPSSSLTPLSVLYMLLLAIQTSIQPRLSRKYIPKHTSKVRVVLVEEVIKTSAASIMFWGISGKEVVQAALKDWTLQSSLLVAGLPACLYAVQGVLTYMSHQHLDSVTFNGLSQTKTLSAALCCYMVMGKRQSPLQLVALGLLFLSAIVFQNHRISGTGANAQTGHDGKGDTSFLIKGVIPCLIATFISGLAGAFSQRGLQMVGGNGRNAFLYTVEVSFFSALALLVPQLISSSSRDSKSVKNQRSAETNDRMLSAKSLIPISSKAMGGILTALVHKYAGSVVKGFALMLGLVMSGILQSLWVEENNKDGSNNDTKATKGALKWHQVAGIAIVMFSSWLHFTNPPVST